MKKIRIGRENGKKDKLAVILEEAKEREMGEFEKVGISKILETIDEQKKGNYEERRMKEIKIERENERKEKWRQWY